MSGGWSRARPLTVHGSLLALLLCAPALAAGQAVRLAASAGGERIVLDAPAIPPRVDRLGTRRLAPMLSWRAVQPGLELATVGLEAGALRMSVEAVVVRVDPARFRFALQHRVEANGMTGTWTIDSAGPAVALAMNAGQFKETGPWGWLAIAGEELRNPARAPLAVGLRIDTTGRLSWVPRGREQDFRYDRATAFAFQSFPLLFFDRRVPAALRDGELMDLGHRDARLVLAESDDGHLLFVLTRFAALGPLAERVPIGLTTPEAVVLAAALGARHAVMLDGGGSAQLVVRDGAGGETRWAGLRRVPLGLVAEPRAMPATRH